MGSMNDRATLAQNRWIMLRDVLLKRNDLQRPDSSSVRVHNSFSLFHVTAVPASSNKNPACCSWQQYKHKGDEAELFVVNIKQATSCISSKDLIGYDNTGNICIWASEEVMAHYCLSNRHLFAKKAVCEVGGGSTNLAGIFVAKYAQPSRVVLSDGSEKALTNLNEIVAANFSDEDPCRIKPDVQLLRWDDEATYQDMLCQFDMVLCADCLFFDGVRRSLALALHKILKLDGEAFIFAPKREKTFDDFVRNARGVFGTCNVVIHEMYDDIVWSHHLASQQLPTYNEDLHYPLLLILTKRSFHQNNIFQ